MLKLQLKRCEQMAGVTIFSFAIFFPNSFAIAANHTTHSHTALWEWQEVGISKIN